VLLDGPIDRERRAGAPSAIAAGGLAHVPEGRGGLRELEHRRRALPPRGGRQEKNRPGRAERGY